jgi:hypothetical protein
MTDLGVWITGGSLLVAAGSFLVSIISLLVARSAKQAATLAIRVQAINHVREAFSDVSLHGVVTGKTVTSLREARHLSALVFSRKITNDLDRHFATADRLNVRPEYRAAQKIEDRLALGKDLQALINRMEQEAALVSRQSW